MSDLTSLDNTGAAYARRGFGNMTGLIWPFKELIVQPFDESPVAPNFTIKNGVLQ